MPSEMIFIVEDDIHIAQLVKYNLEAAGYSTSLFENGDDAINAVNRAMPTLIVLDIMLPGKDGIEVLKAVRSRVETRVLPVVLLTAKGDEFDKILGLELGADDYIAKPFSVRELVARVKAVLRRSDKSVDTPKEHIISAGAVSIDTDSHRVYLENQELDLTLKEFELLECLVTNSGKVVKRDILLDNIWGYDAAIETRTVDVHIRRLRQLIGEKYIDTVRGVGYRFNSKA